MKITTAATLLFLTSSLAIATEPQPAALDVAADVAVVPQAAVEGDDSADLEKRKGGSGGGGGGGRGGSSSGSRGGGIRGGRGGGGSGEKDAASTFAISYAALAAAIGATVFVYD